MNIETVTSEFAATVESAEIHAWIDLYDAAPGEFRSRFRPELLHVGDVVLTRCTQIPFVHFNCVMNLGLASIANEELLDEILGMYRAENVRAFAIYHNPMCRPAALTAWFENRGLRAHGGWDRIYRDSSLPANGVRGSGEYYVEKVDSSSAGEWADFLDRNYGLPTAPWLLALVNRPHWHHYVLRSANGIVAVRSMYLHADGMAWLGIEAPVPGLMTPSFELDRRLCTFIVNDGVALGATCFVADIEAPSSTMDTAPYVNFSSLGFRKLYFRSHYRYGTNLKSTS